MNMSSHLKMLALGRRTKILLAVRTECLELDLISIFTIFVDPFSKWPHSRLR